MDLLHRAFGDSRSAALTLGTSTVVLTHAYMLVTPEDDMTRALIVNHALLNLAAAGAIVYGSRLLG